MTALSDLLQRHKRDGESNRQLAARSKGAVSRGTVDKYMSGDHGAPSEEVLRAFHELLGIPLRELREAAHKPVGEAQQWRPPEVAHLMNRRQRKAVAELIRSFVETQGVAHAVSSDQTASARTSTQGRPPEEDEFDEQDLALPPPEIHHVAETTTTLPDITEHIQDASGLGGSPGVGGDVDEDTPDAASDG